MIAIIDYGSGNLQSVKKAFNYLKVEAKIISAPEEITKAARLVLPGVGNFGEAMMSLKKRKLLTPLKKGIYQGRSYLGICLGLQVLFEESEESPGVRGLGIFKGQVKKFRQGKIPQIGWNKVIPQRNAEVFEEGYAYFVNSYYVLPRDESLIATITDYFGEFVSAVKKDNVVGVQFHPEKSGDYGLELLRRWLEQC